MTTFITRTPASGGAVITASGGHIVTLEMEAILICNQVKDG